MGKLVSKYSLVAEAVVVGAVVLAVDVDVVEVVEVAEGSSS